MDRIYSRSRSLGASCLGTGTALDATMHPVRNRGTTKTQMLSQKAKYALRAAIMLAERADQPDTTSWVLIAEIAERENIPRKFLEAILVELRNHGLLESRRGKNGGYRLAKPLDRIAFGDVIRLIDGPLAPIRCASRSQFQPCEDCADVGTCSIRWAMLKARDAMASVLDAWTLADAVNQRRATGVIPLDFAV